jgi:hypothetical protein
LAEAVEASFPGVKFWVGPAVDRGFYYDMDLGDRHLVEDDLISLEKTMVELASKNNVFVKKEINKTDAIAYFTKKGDEYKLDLLSGLNDGEITFYTQGDFTDLCRGPHIPHTGLIKAIKLTSVAGAYWKGDEKNKMLTRIYGITFPKDKELKEYLVALEEAKKLGEYDVKFGDFVGKCYIYFAWINDDFDECVQEFKSEDGSSLWLRFSMGFIPVDEETLYSFNEAETRTGYPNSKISYSISPSDNGVWWIQDFGINLSKSVGLINQNDISLYPDIEEATVELIPGGDAYIEGIEFPAFYFADRANAQKFKTMLHKLFNSEIIFNADSNRPGGMVEMIREEIVGEYGFGFNEYLRFVESIKRIRVNSLYRD